MKKKPEDPPSTFWKEMLNSFIESEKDAMRFAKVGAIVGASIGVAFGLYFLELFGWLGVGAGIIVGYVVGGIGAWLMYQTA